MPAVLQQFSTFDHITTEYERAELLDRFTKLQSKIAEVSAGQKDD